jgi:hypothetical protein
MLWFVKEYIAQLKGNLMNWAITAISTTKEKAHRQLMNGLKSGSINLSNFSCGESVGRFESDGLCVIHTMKVEKWSVVGEDAKCPFGVSTSEILLVGDMHVFLCDLLIIEQTRCLVWRHKR